MFGFAERGRLAMYDVTLRQAKTDAHEGTLFHMMALVVATGLLGTAARDAAGRPKTFTFQSTLGETLESIPSVYLSGIDAYMMRWIASPKLGEDQAGYQMATLVNGLVFVRVVEVSRPALCFKAYSFRDSALSFIEPMYEVGMKIMRAPRDTAEVSSVAGDA
jgi:hypothetical protein